LADDGTFQRGFSRVTLGRDSHGWTDEPGRITLPTVR